MTKVEEAKAIIVGSFVLYLIDALLDKSEQNHLSTIRLRQCIRAKTSRTENHAYVKMSNDAWIATVAKYEENSMHIAIFDAVETLVFDHEKIMTDMFGSNIMMYTNGFTQKQTRDGVPREILLQSREVSKALKKSLEKVVFDKKGEL